MTDNTPTKPAFRFNLHGGQMGIIRADNLQVAKREALMEYGRYNITGVTPAKQEDIDWFISMGGTIHDNLKKVEVTE